MNNISEQRLNDIIDRFDELAMRYPEIILPSFRSLLIVIVHNLHYVTQVGEGEWAVVPIRRIVKDGVGGDDVICLIDELYGKLGLVSI